MKNGIEVRKNGAKIQRTPSGVCYAVTLPDGTPSKNGPWDYLGNARKDAGGGYPQHGR